MRSWRSQLTVSTSSLSPQEERDQVASQRTCSQNCIKNLSGRNLSLLKEVVGKREYADEAEAEAVLGSLQGCLKDTTISNQKLKASHTDLKIAFQAMQEKHDILQTKSKSMLKKRGDLCSNLNSLRHNHSPCLIIPPPRSPLQALRIHHIVAQLRSSFVVRGFRITSTISLKSFSVSSKDI